MIEVIFGEMMGEKSVKTVVFYCENATKSNFCKKKCKIFAKNPKKCNKRYGLQQKCRFFENDEKNHEKNAYIIKRRSLAKDVVKMHKTSAGSLCSLVKTDEFQNTLLTFDMTDVIIGYSYHIDEEFMRNCKSTFVCKGRRR